MSTFLTLGMPPGDGQPRRGQALLAGLVKGREAEATGVELALPGDLGGDGRGESEGEARRAIRHRWAASAALVIADGATVLADAGAPDDYLAELFALLSHGHSPVLAQTEAGLDIHAQATQVLRVLAGLTAALRGADVLAALESAAEPASAEALGAIPEPAAAAVRELLTAAIVDDPAAVEELLRARLTRRGPGPGP